MMENMKINQLPSKTWNWLKMNETAISGITVSGKFSLRYSFQSKTASTAAIATSVISGVGSLVVSFCRAMPGFDKRDITQ